MDTDKLFEAIQEIKQDIAVIKSEMTSIKSIPPKVEEIEKKLIQQDAKIEQLENTNNKMWVIISGVIVGVAVALIKVFLKI